MEWSADRHLPDEHDDVTTAAAAGHWRLAPGQALAHRCWDGEYVVFNDLSGDTHLLAGDAFALLQSLARAPASEAALAGPEGDPTALLAELEALSLIEFIPC